MAHLNRNSNTKGNVSRENVPSLMLSNTNNEQFFKLIGQKNQSLATAVTQVFVADGDGKRWSKKCCGVAGFIKDNPKRSYYIRVYDIEAGIKIWEQELYNRFKYNCDRPWFHTFEADKCMAALNFANDQDAKKFYDVIQEKLKRREQNKMNRRATRASMMNSGGANRRPPPNPTLNAPASQPVSLGLSAPAPLPTMTLDNKSAKNKPDNKKDKKKKLTKDQIGLPSDFKHVGHIGFNPQTGFDTNSLDPEMKQLFSEAGVTDEQLKDKDTAAYIYDFLEQQGGLERVKHEASVKRRPPVGGRPPPPPSMGNAPPPPMRTTSAAAPPPPPSRIQAPPPPSISRPAAPPPPNRGGPSQARAGRPGLPPPPAPPGVRPPPPPTKHGIAPAAAPPPPPAGAPPPPPAPPPGPAPPPPPPPSGFDSAPAAAPADGRSALLQAIRGGTTLKAVDSQPARSPSPVDQRSSMLKEIQHGIALNKVDPASQPAPELEEGTGLAAALAKALKNRQVHIQDDDDEDDSDGAFDDDDWD